MYREKVIRGFGEGSAAHHRTLWGSDLPRHVRNRLEQLLFATSWQFGTVKAKALREEGPEG